MKIDNVLINDIRNKVDIVELISNYIPLTTRGKNYFCVCPFHDDHSPSMSISKERQIYTCFSCGATGNVFKFLQDYEHISFVEAVKKCADMCGIQLDVTIKSENSNIKKYQELYDIYSISQKFYQNNINSSLGHKAKEYLYSRQLTDNEIKKFGIGLSLNDYDMLVKLLKQKKFSDKDLLKSGLINANDNGLYDVYRSRIMYPLHDINGNVVGYNGRIYQGEEINKYINSKESEIFKKRDFLFNYHRAKDCSREKKEIIVMEGPMDVIRASTIGIENVVATLGTAIGTSQCNLIKRLSSNVILCFDGDEAGTKATKTALREFQKVGISPKIVCLPVGQDPDEYIRQYGQDKFSNLLNNAYNIVEYKEYLLKKDINFNNPEDISNYIKSMIEEINQIDDDILKEITINKLCDDTKISKETILNKLQPTKENKVEVVIPKKKNYSKYEKSAQNLIYYMMRNPEVIKIYDKKITHIEDARYRHLAFQISTFFKQNGYINIADLLTELRDDEESIKTIGIIESLDIKKDFCYEEIDDYLNNIKEYNDLKRIDKYKTELAMSNDLSQKLELANKLIEFKLRSEENDR